MSAPVLVALSGGVDSAVAARLLQEAGETVEALFMKNWEEDDDAEYCAAAADLEDARAVCARLDIPLHTVNFAAEYWRRVFAGFLAEYEAGRTPNPDIVCNREIKFRAFLERARALGAGAIATGHYAGARRNGAVELLRGADEAKDQSYFLHRLDQEQLRAARFPLHRRRKPEVRALARALGLRVHDKKDSTGLCFIGERRFRDFLARYLPESPGDIVTPAGRKLGEHPGPALLHPGPARRPRPRRGRGRGRRALVCDRQGAGDAAPDGHPGPRPSDAERPRTGDRGAALDRGPPAAGAPAARPHPPPPAAAGMRVPSVRPPRALRRAAVGARAGTVGGVLRRRRLPGRRRHRAPAPLSEPARRPGVIILPSP